MARTVRRSISLPSRYWVASARTERVASQQTPQAQPAAPQRAVSCDCLASIHRAARLIPTWGWERRSRDLVRSNEPHERHPWQPHYEATDRTQARKSSRSDSTEAWYAGRRDRITTSKSGISQTTPRRAISRTRRRTRFRATAELLNRGTTTPSRGCPRSFARQEISSLGVRRRRPSRRTACKSVVRVRRQLRPSPSGVNALRALTGVAPSDACGPSCDAY